MIFRQTVLKTKRSFSFQFIHRTTPFASLLAALIFVTGCAHSVKNDFGRGSVARVIQEDSEKGAAPHMTTSNGEIYFRGVKLKESRFDYPVTVNSRVEYWVDYFCGRGREVFTRYLERSEFFIPYIKPLLKQNGMPEDLVFLAMIESGFNNLARSRARAVGPWQFISATGKRYGLMVNWWVDERRDVKKSTLAAIEYLKDLNSMFQSWELAAAAYNSGEAKIARAVRRFGTKDFWTISKHRFLKQETRDYVPKIIAAAIVSKNREQFGFALPDAHPGADEAVAGDGEIVKVIKSDKPEDERLKQDIKEVEEFAAIDDGFADDEEPPVQGITPATLLVPADNQLPDGQIVKNEISQPLAKPVPMPHLTKGGSEVGGVQLSEFDVQSPADLLKVARAAGLSYATIKSLNPELLRWCTPPTVSSYRIKLPVNVKDKFLTTYNHAAYPRKVEFMTYRVRKSETLSRIAQHYGIKVDPITDLNGVSPRMPLRNGVHVLVPMPNDRSRSLATLDVRDPPERRRVRHHRRRRAKYQKVIYTDDGN